MKMNAYDHEGSMTTSGSQMAGYSKSNSFAPGHMLNQRESLRDPTAFDTAHETFGAAHRLADRVMNMVESIAGSYPTKADGSKEGLSAVSNGRLDSLRSGAYGALAAIQRANEALDRLDSQI